MRTEKCSLPVMVLFLTLSSSSLPAKEPEEIWREVNAISGEQRQNLVLSKAKAEGEVVWYSSTSAESLQPLSEEFGRRYPDIKLKIWRGSGERIVNRVLTEAKAGKFDADVISGGNEFLPTLMKAGLIGLYNSPERRFYSPSYKDGEGYWTSYAFTVAVIVYNTNLVTESQAPREYNDFLNSKWKGKFAIDTDPDRALMGWLKNWGEERTAKYLRGLINNDVQVRRGHTLITQLLCAGEFEAAVELYAYRLAELIHKGCPARMVFPEPTPGALTPLVVSKRSPHPYAAALLVDYALSETGQRILAGKGWSSGRRGVEPKYPEINVEAKGVRLLLLRPEDADRLGEKYQQLRDQFLLKR